MINGEISAKFYGKRNSFSFFIVCKPKVHSNIPLSVFYGSVMSKILHIAR